MKPLAPVGRILFSLIFLFSAKSHFDPGTIGWAEASGVPFASFLVPASGVLALLAGLSIALGYRAKWGAAAIVAFLVPITLAMHKFWAIPDPMMAQLQFAMFMKNVSLIGAALYFVHAGAGAFSLDEKLATRRLTPARA